MRVPSLRSMLLDDLRGCPRKANFGPSPISLSFSVKVENSIPCTNITFILIIFHSFYFLRGNFKGNFKLPNLPSVTPIIKL